MDSCTKDTEMTNFHSSISTLKQLNWFPDWLFAIWPSCCKNVLCGVSFIVNNTDLCYDLYSTAPSSLRPYFPSMIFLHLCLFCFSFSIKVNSFLFFSPRSLLYWAWWTCWKFITGSPVPLYIILKDKASVVRFFLTVNKFHEKKSKATISLSISQYFHTLPVPLSHKSPGSYRNLSKSLKTSRNYIISVFKKSSVIS